MESEHALVEQEGIQFGRSLWSHQLGQHGEIEDDQLDLIEEEANFETPEGPATARHLCSTRTLSRATPKEQSPSGLVYQRASRSLVECSKPTMNIRSLKSTFVSSVNPLPPPKDPSLMRWIHTVNSQSLAPRLENSPSQKRGKLRSALQKLTG
nr:MAG: movement protein [Hubei polero-like virus 2]UVK78431.1 MAG: movement protein [Hubei polero-like virus 2]